MRNLRIIKIIYNFFLILVFTLYSSIYLNALGNSNKNKVLKLASIKTSKANLRYGPGFNYPIKLIFIQKKMPLIIIDQFDHWRKIVTQDEVIGWLHKSQISMKLTSSIVTEDYLRKKPNLSSKKVAFLKKKVNVTIIKCKDYWCKIELSNRKYFGWYIKKYLWGSNYIILK